MQMLSKWMKLYREVNKTWRKWERGQSLSRGMLGHNFETQWGWQGSNIEMCQAGFWLPCWQKWESVELIFKCRWGCAEACCCYDETSRCVCLDLVFEEAFLVPGFLRTVRKHDKKIQTHSLIERLETKAALLGWTSYLSWTYVFSQDAQQAEVALTNHIASCKSKNQRVLFWLAPLEWV